MNKRELRFWNKAAIDDGCWNWTASTTTSGYGCFKDTDRTRTASRVAYEFWHGPIPHKACVLHHCDNRKCIRPSHLYLGTPALNAKDRKDRGRSGAEKRCGLRSGAYTKPECVPRGSRAGLAKLTEADAIAIREQYATGQTSQRKLAREYGVSQPAIGSLLRRETWTHV